MTGVHYKIIYKYTLPQVTAENDTVIVLFFRLLMHCHFLWLLRWWEGGLKPWKLSTSPQKRLIKQRGRAVEACQATLTRLTAFSEESPAGPAPKCSGPSLDLQFQARCLTIFSSCASFSLTFPHNVSTPPPETRPLDFLAFSLATALEAMLSLLPIPGAVDNAFRRPRMKLLLRRTHSAYRVLCTWPAPPAH